MDWRAELREVTGYNPSDPKFRQRDRQKIRDSSYHQTLEEEIASLKAGIEEDRQDMERERKAARRR